MVPTYFDKSHLLSIRLLQAQQPHSFFNKLNIQQQLIYADFDLVSSNQRIYFVSSEDCAQVLNFSIPTTVAHLPGRVPPSCSLGCLRLSSLASCAPQTGHLLHACRCRSTFK